MIDYRVYEKQAKELVDSGKPMVFRLILPNGNIAERHITPVSHTLGSDFYYTDTKYVYTLENKNAMKLKCIETTKMSPQTTKNGVIYGFIASLLKEYTFCNQKK